MASTTKRTHRLTIEVLDPVPTAEDHYSELMEEEITKALAQVGLKLNWIFVAPVEVEDEA